MPGNLLVANGRLTAVIDFGCLETGDPAWNLLPAEARTGHVIRVVLDEVG